MLSKSPPIPIKKRIHSSVHIIFALERLPIQRRVHGQLQSISFLCLVWRRNRVIDVELPGDEIAVDWDAREELEYDGW